MGANKMKKILLSLILSSVTGLVLAEEVKNQPTDREIDVIRILLEDDIKAFIDDGEAQFNEEYKNNERLLSLKERVPAETILKTYSENEVRGDKHYKDKKFIVTGMIKGIDSGFGDEPYITFTTKNKYSFNTVQARFKKSEQDKLVDLNKGQKIEIYCTGAGEITGSPMLKNCEFVNKTEIINDALSASLKQFEKLKSGDIVNVPTEFRQIAFFVSVASKKTNDFAECKDKISLKCVDKLLGKILKQSKSKVIAEFAPLAEYLQVEQK